MEGALSSLLGGPGAGGWGGLGSRAVVVVSPFDWEGFKRRLMPQGGRGSGTNVAAVASFLSEVLPLIPLENDAVDVGSVGRRKLRYRRRVGGGVGKGGRRRVQDAVHPSQPPTPSPRASAEWISRQVRAPGIQDSE